MPKTVDVEVLEAREQTLETVADAVSIMVAAANLGIRGKKSYKWKKRVCEKGMYTGSKEISRRLGRDVRQTILRLQKASVDPRISTIADIAHATGHRIKFVIIKKR